MRARALFDAPRGQLGLSVEKTMNDLPVRSTAKQGVVTGAEFISNVKARLAMAESNTSRLHQLGSQEQYLESYFLVEALQSQLESLLKEQRTTRAV
jgi:hypothetical protein